MTPERLFSELVSVIRSSNPDLLGRPLTLRTIQQSLIPYQIVRDRLQLECSEDYEMLLLRLCAGEGELFTIGDATASEAFRRETEAINPDLGLLETHDTVSVHLNVGSSRRTATASSRRAEAYRPPGERDRHTPEDAEGEATVIAFTPPPEPPELPTPPPIPEPTPLTDAAPAAAPDITFDIGPATPDERGTARDAATTTCSECGGGLPAHREVRFCPHCGHHHADSACRHCGADLEPDWRHCIECGRPTG